MEMLRGPADKWEQFRSLGKVWKCGQARSAHRGRLPSEPQGADGEGERWLPQSLLFLLRKLGLLQDLNVQSSKPDVLILFTDLAIGFVAFIEKQLFKGPYSTVLELDPSWSQLEPKLCCWLDKLFTLFVSLFLQQRNTTYHSVCVRIKQQIIATKQMKL